MITNTYRIFGQEGHRQRLSFEKSFTDDFPAVDQRQAATIHVACADETGTNEYVLVTITAADPDAELLGQLTDGLFENIRTGRVEKPVDGAWMELCWNDGGYAWTAGERRAPFGLEK